MPEGNGSIWSHLPLTVKFILIAVPLTLIITVSTFVYLQTTQNRAAEVVLEERLGNVAKIEASTLSGPLWNFNQRQVELILSAMINDPDIVEIIVRDDSTSEIASIAAAGDDGERITITEPINHVTRQGSPAEEIGTLEVTYSKARLEAAIATSRRSAVLVTGFLTAAVVLSALIALHLTVRTPLLRFQGAIDAAREESRYIPVDLSQHDEIGKVADAYNSLQAKQSSDEAELRRIRDNLEKLVDERTKELAGRERELSETVLQLKAREAELIVARDTAQDSLENLRRTRDRLVQSEKMASLGQLTAGIAHEIKNPLNFVNNFSSLSIEMLEELRDATEAAKDRLTPEEVEEVEDLVATISGNLGKIAEHGKRADTIVRNMLLHSRDGPAEASPAQLNAVLEEALNLSYHSSRAEIDGFNIGMERDYAEGLGNVECYPQDLARVFINILSNGMYATHKRAQSGDDSYAPTIAVATEDLGDHALVRITDNGGGIAAEDVENIFTPFFTTKPAGEGTGLGLSISYDIVVSQHGGDIKVTSQPDEGTEFTITLPKAMSHIEDALERT